MTRIELSTLESMGELRDLLLKTLLLALRRNRSGTAWGCSSLERGTFIEQMCEAHEILRALWQQGVHVGQRLALGLARVFEQRTGGGD
ncbi:MAG: hypothetical protein B7Z80_06615, partial [Rhodospirillales bacterium 20-64-7]